jgi:hypothetical protein
MRRLLILVPMLLVFASLSARADDRLEVNWREARVVRLAKPATSVIIGDPTVADVTLDDPSTLVVFGKSPGETNIIVLSATQEMLVNWPLLVSPQSDRHVSVLNATGSPAPSEVLYSCGAERCARVLSPSDISFSASTSQNSTSSSDSSKSASSNGEPAVGGGAANQAGAATQNSTAQ